MSEIEARQRNILWPDTLGNSALVDAFLWKGSPDATRVQRIGMALIGLMYSGPGVLFVCIGCFDGGPVLYRVCMFLMALPSLALGGKLLRNVFRH